MKTIYLRVSENDYKPFEYNDISELSEEFEKRNIKVGKNLVVGKDVTIDNDVTIGNDVKIGKYVTIGKYVKIGNSVKIGNDVTIRNNVTIGNDVTIRYNVAIGNNVTIEDNDKQPMEKGIYIGDTYKIGEKIYRIQEMKIEHISSPRVFIVGLVFVNINDKNDGFIESARDFISRKNKKVFLPKKSQFIISNNFDELVDVKSLELVINDQVISAFSDLSIDKSNEIVINIDRGFIKNT